MNFEEEFDRQAQNLLQKDYPKIAGVTEAGFLQYIEPLRKKLENVENSEVDLENGQLPFVIVVKSALVPAEDAMVRVEREGKEGITKLFPHAPADFEPIDSVSIPESQIYLLIGIDRGKETLNVRPADALKIIQEQNRTPLTIEEGIAIITHFPDFLKKNNCFSLLASRHSGDQRVPAIWINFSKNPNLGWCWDGNPHTWLGSASCAKRAS